MATVKCSLGKRGQPSHEWNDGEKDHIYCMGYVDRMTDDPLPECLSCPDHVSHANDDMDSFYKEQGGLTMEEKRLIDANLVIDRLKTNIVLGETEKAFLRNYVNCCPTLDAVEVVRCKDCKFCVIPYGDEHDGWIECSNIHGRPLFSRDGFCSLGERRTDG